MRKIAFLDRDGTIIEDVSYLSDIAQIKIIPGMIKFCLQLQKAGYELFVVTNQSGIARGYFDEKFVEKTHIELKKIFKELGVNLKQFYYCPHHPEYGRLGERKKKCTCRKPQGGMLLQAAKEHDINLNESLMFGDRMIDVLAGNAVGCRSFLMEQVVESGFNLEKILEEYCE